MRIKNGYWKWVAAVVSTVAFTAANAGSATFDFETDPRNTFEDVTSTQEDFLWSSDGDFPGTGNPGEYLSITEATGSTSTIAIFPDIDGGELVKAFNLKMDIRTGNGSTDRPADGFSISYARAGDPVFDGFSMPGPPENGTATGIVVSFDTWQGNTLTDGSGDIEGIIVVVDGESVNKTALPTRHGDCDDITSLQTGPLGSDDSDFPRGDPGALCWAPFEVNLTEDGLLTVTYKGNVVLDGFQSNFFPSQCQLVIAGRTGGANEILHVDNIELNTILAGNEVLLSGLSSDVSGFTVSFREEGSATLDPASIDLTLDGEAVTGDISKDGNVTTVVYSQNEFFASGSEHTVGIKAAGGISKEVDFTTPSYAVIGGENALSGNFSERGFQMRVLQANQAIPTAIGPREEHLAGTLVDADGNPLENFIDDFGFKGDIIEIEGVINFEQDGNPQGVFRDLGDGSVADVFDDFIPGIPGIDGSTDQITAEILTVVEIPSSGLYNFAFTSDDGFRTTAGAVSDAQNAIVISEFNGGRGSATSFGTALFQEPGFYKLRSLWFEGGGGANLEWWTADLEGNPIALLNDDAAGGLKTYRTIPEDPASIAAISPADGTSEVPANTTVSIVVKNGSTSYDDGSASGTLNGDALAVDVTSGDGTVTLSADLADLPGNSEFTWEISFTAGGIARSAGGTFNTTVLAGEGLLFIETEDFNFELGKWDTTNDIGMSGGAYPGGTYQDLGDGLDETDVDAGTSYGVDYFESANDNLQAIYRPDTGVEAGKMNGSAGQFRGSFDVETNHTVGWNDGGDWFNYTRDFPEPAQSYNIYGHLSSGGDPIDVSLLKVTSEATTSAQDTEVIGHWRPGRATAGWDNLEIFPLTDDDGNAAVASLGGRTTLRYSVNGGHNDNDFIVFVPASGAAPAPDVQNGLVALWNFDSGNFQDSVGAFHGEGNGTAPIQFAPGRPLFGQALALDGTDQMVEITGGEPDDLAFEGGSVSIGAWFKVGAFDKNWQAMVAKGEGSNWRVARRSGSNLMSYAGGIGDTPDSGPDVNDGEWHHLVAVTDASGAEFGGALYIDGALAATTAGVPALSANGKRVMIGENPDARGRYWNGVLDDVAIWNRALSATEIEMVASGLPLGGIAAPPIVLPPIPGGGGGEVSGITNNGDGTVTIEFTGGLQSSDTVDGTYAPVAGASPLTVGADAASKFYLAR